MARDVRARAEIETRCADINVMIRPSADSGRLGAAGRALFEGALFGGGRSLLLVPQDWRGPPIGQNVVIAWRNRREAARAVADASPLLDVARDICVMSVGEQARGLYSVSEEDVAAHLGRRGLKAHAEWRAGDNEGEVLLKACADAGADLLVMGGFGRAQWRETLLGGVTQTVLASARLPVLMSH